MRIATIFLYYLIFILASIFFVKADRSNNDKAIRAYIICGVVILSLFACFRGPIVGWDTRDTVDLYFNRAKSYDSIKSIFTYSYRFKEPIYIFFSFLLQKITDSGRVFLFFMQLLTVGPVAVVAYKKRNTLSISVIMFVYMMLFYQRSFNIVRQSVATAFLFLGWVYLTDRKFVKATLIFVLTCMLHSSGIIGVALVLALYIFTNDINVAIRYCMIFVAIIVGAVTLTVWKSLALNLIEGGILNERYSGYVSIMSGDVSNQYNTIQFRDNAIEIMRLLGTIIVMLFLKGKHTGSNREILFLKYSVILSFIIYTIVEVGFGVTLGHRLTIYIDYFQMALFAHYYPKSTFDDKRISTGVIIIPKTGVRYGLAYCMLYNFIIYMFVNYGHTLPYQLT